MIEINGMKMYDSKEISKLFNVCETTVSNLRRRGLLRYTRIGRKAYTSEDALRDYLNGLSTPEKVNK